MITVLSGMSNVEQMQDNLSYMKDFNGLTEKEQETLKKAQEEWLVGKHGRKSANECVKCGKCEEVCPQHIKIRDELEKVATELLGK